MSAPRAGAGQRVERDDRAAEALGQRARAGGVAVGDEDRRDALVGERLRGQLARLAGADDHDVAVGEVARRPRAQVDGDGRDAGAAAADRRSRVRTRLPVCSAALEQAVRQRPGRAGGERELVGAPDLALDLGLADDHRLQAAGDAEELARGVAVARRVDDVGELGRADAGAVGEACRARRSRPATGSPRRGRARCGCRSRSRRPRWTSACAVSSRRKRSASLLGSARRSRSATGAVLCEMPSASSSLIAARPPRARRRPAPRPRAARSSTSSLSSVSSRSKRASFDAMIAT